MTNRLPWYVVLVLPVFVLAAWYFTRDPKTELAVQPAPGMTLTETAEIGINRPIPRGTAVDIVASQQMARLNRAALLPNWHPEAAKLRAELKASHHPQSQ